MSDTKEITTATILLSEYERYKAQDKAISEKLNLYYGDRYYYGHGFRILNDTEAIKILLDQILLLGNELSEARKELREYRDKKK